mgnify:FL=1
MNKRSLFSRTIHLGIIYMGIFFVFSSHAQAQMLFPKAIPMVPSPEVSSLLRNVMNPVDLYSGVLDVQIPLYNLSYKDMQVPIVASYRTSGIKVHDLPTWVGLGWNLSAGGKISRVVRGKPDERGYCNGDGELVGSNYSTWSTNKLNSIIDAGETDFEPDLFYFQLPGRSGMFVVNYNMTTYTVPYSNIEINWVNKDYFIVTDENGWKYTFGQNAKESTTVTSYGKGYSRGKTETYTSVWYLESITNAQRKSITFSYTSGDALQYLDYNIHSRVVVDPVAQGSKIKSETIPYSQTSVSVQPCYLSEIYAGRFNVKFKSSITTFGPQNPRKLDDIEIHINREFLKKIKFSYSSFANKALKLDNIREQAGNKELLIARFDYNTNVNLPGRDTKDFDHWGYYNEAGNSGYRPSFTYNSVASCPGANREPSFNHAKANILTKVWNNLGGYTEYIYGANRARSNGATDEIIGGIRIDSVKQYADGGNGLVTKYEYKLGNGTSSGTKYAGKVMYVPPRVSPDPRATVELTCPALSVNSVYDLNGSPIAYSRIKEIYPNGAFSVYSYTSYTESEDIPIDYSVPYPALTEGWQYFLTPTSLFWMRGLLTSKQEYDKEQHLTKVTSKKYSMLSYQKASVFGYCPINIILQNGVLIHERFRYQWPVYPVFMTEETSDGNHIVQSKAEYTYDSIYIFPKEVKTTNMITGEVARTKIKYPFDFESGALNNTQKVITGIHFMQQSHMYNYPLEIVNEKEGKVIGGQIMEYEIFDLNFDNILQLKRIRRLITPEPLSDYITYHNDKQKLVMDSRYKDVKELFYDNDGHVVSTRENEHTCESVIYETETDLPIADVTNGVPYTTRYTESRGSRPFLNLDENHPCSYDLGIQPSEMIIGKIAVAFKSAVVPTREFTVNYPDKGVMVSKQIPALALRKAIDFIGASQGQGIYVAVSNPNEGTVQFQVVITFESRKEYMGGNVFHTSFENNPDAIKLPHAKTGLKVLKNTLHLPLKNFDAGNYELTYWKSTDGVNWQKMSEEITISSASPTKIIGSSSYYIDEVRLVKKDAMIKTRTFLQGVGVNSETDHNGQTIYYEYDEFGRLTRVLDNNRNEIKKYEYVIGN